VAADAEDEGRGVGQDADGRGLGRGRPLVRLDPGEGAEGIRLGPGGLVEDAVQAEVGREAAGAEDGFVLLLGGRGGAEEDGGGDPEAQALGDQGADLRPARRLLTP
jgi:hypothetical protein